MAFFDEIGKKLSQTGQMAFQKTKEMADIAKLNSNITEEEKKISNMYYQIGQLYVSLHEIDFDPDFEVLITQLKESSAKIEDLKKQIQDVKGVKRCTNCGAEIPNNSTFCSSCGAAVIQEKAVDISNLVKCANCGKMVEKGMNFCTFCGSPMVVANDEIKESICENCGAELNDGAAFCIKCGTPVKVEAEETNLVEITESPENIKNSYVAPEPVIKTCANCGAVVDDEAAFCSECGNKIN